MKEDILAFNPMGYQGYIIQSIGDYVSKHSFPLPSDQREKERLEEEG